MSLSSAMIALGAGNAANPVDVLARANFTAAATKIDCTKVVCGIFVRRDHLAPTDTSLDTFVPVTFSAAVATPVAKKITAVVTKNQVIVSIVGYKGTAVTITVGSTVKTVTPTTNGYTFKVALGKGKKATVKVTKGKSSLFSKKITN